MKPKYPDAQQHHQETWGHEVRDYQFLEHLDGVDIWLADEHDNDGDGQWGVGLFLFAKFEDSVPNGDFYHFTGFTARNVKSWDRDVSYFPAPQTVWQRVRAYLTLHQ